MKPYVTIITLGVGDLAASVRFYCEGLGWPNSSASNEGIAFIRMNSLVLGLYPHNELAEDANVQPAAAAEFRGVALAHNVASREDVDRVLQEAEAAGAKITQPASDVFWGGYRGYFADPDGHLWEVAWNPFFPLAADGTVELPA